MDEQEQQNEVQEEQQVPNPTLSSKKKWFAIIGLIVVLSFLFSYLVTFDSSYGLARHCYTTWQHRVKVIDFSSRRESVSYDLMRLSDIKQMQLALDIYFERHSAYPLVTGDSSRDSWDNLVETLLQENIIGAKINDPCERIGTRKNRKVNPEFQYEYGHSDSRDSYVLKTLFESQESFAIRETVLTNDVDGEKLGIWCGEQGSEREYCIVSDKQFKGVTSSIRKRGLARQ